MVTLSLFRYWILIIANLLLLSWYIYTAILFHRARLDKETAKRWKTICKIKNISLINCEKILIRKFVDDYTEEHKIEWK